MMRAKYLIALLTVILASCSESKLKIGADTSSLLYAGLIRSTHIKDFYFATDHTFHGVYFSYAGVYTHEDKIDRIMYSNSSDSLQPSFVEDKRKIESVLDSIYGHPFYSDKYSKKWKDGDIAYDLTEICKSDSTTDHSIIIKIGYYEQLKNEYCEPSINRD